MVVNTTSGGMSRPGVYVVAGTDNTEREMLAQTGHTAAAVLSDLNTSH